MLRLFTATVGKLSAERLAQYLQMTLQHSRKSRKYVLILSAVCITTEDWRSYTHTPLMLMDDKGCALVTVRTCDLW